MIDGPDPQGAHLLVQCQRKRFEEDINERKPGPHIGMLLGWRRWVGGNRELLSLKQPGTMWIVTVRPDGHVWLIAMYKGARLENGSAPFRINSEGNKLRVVDITHLVLELRFEDRKPITSIRGHWRNAFQRVSRLTPESVRLLQIVSGQPVDAVAPSTNAIAGTEGELVAETIRRRTRDNVLRGKRLLLDGHTCQACQFRGHPRVRERVVDVHHVDPLRDAAGKVKTTLDDLVTLCPTCHRLVHVLADLMGRKKKLDVTFLRGAAERFISPRSRLQLEV
jgi:hypothetical protein